MASKLEAHKEIHTVLGFCYNKIIGKSKNFAEI